MSFLEHDLNQGMGCTTKISWRAKKVFGWFLGHIGCVYQLLYQKTRQIHLILGFRGPYVVHASSVLWIKCCKYFNIQWSKSQYNINYFTLHLKYHFPFIFWVITTIYLPYTWSWCIRWEVYWERRSSRESKTHEFWQSVQVLSFPCQDDLLANLCSGFFPIHGLIFWSSPDCNYYVLQKLPIDQVLDPLHLLHHPHSRLQQQQQHWDNIFNHKVSETKNGQCIIYDPIMESVWF